ncbi:MAG: EamA family transporter [Williamsia sp.]|nr:EamA family transporter [Williamsia sp.]
MIETILTSGAVLLRIISNPVGNVFQKQLTQKGHHPLFVNFFTYFSLSLLCLAGAFFINWPLLPPSFWIYSILGGIAGALGNGFLVRSLQMGDLSVLGPINAYKSVISMIIGLFLLHEIPNGWGLMGVALIIYGSYYVLDTGEQRFSWNILKRAEIKLRIWAMILTAIEAVLVKKVILASSPLLGFISWCWFGALFSFLLLFFNKLQPGEQIKKLTPAAIQSFGLLVLCIGTMQFTTNWAFGHMPVAYALSLFQLSTIVSVLLGHRIFQEKDIRKKLIGSFIMLVGSVAIIQLS